VIPDWTFSRETFIRTTLELAKQLDGYTIYYKLRPEEYSGWKERYPTEFQHVPNLRVIDSDAVPLYDYFARCRWQVGINSTALYEGLGFGLTTFVLKDGWYEETRRLYDGGFAFLVDEPAEIAAKVRAQALPPVALDMDAVFASGSMQRMAEAARQLLDRSTSPSGEPATAAVGVSH
jgi:hypothetical protein